MEDFGMLEHQFSLARSGGYSHSHTDADSATDGWTAMPPSSDFIRKQDEKIGKLIDQCKAIRISDLPCAFKESFQERLYEQGLLADRLETIPGCVVLNLCGGDQKVIKVEFLAFLLLTKGFYEAFGPNPEQWPSKESKILTHVDKLMNEMAFAHPIIKDWFQEAPPNLWNKFSDFLISAECISWFRDGVNWRPKSVKVILQSHDDSLKGFIGPSYKLMTNGANNTKPPKRIGIKGKSTRASKSGSNWKQTFVDSESILSAIVSGKTLFSPTNADAGAGRSISAAVNFRITDRKIIMIEIVSADACFLIDCSEIGVGTACRYLSDFFANENTLKLFHNLFQPAIAALRADGDVTSFCGCVDTQLALEYLTGETFGGLNKMTKHFEVVVDEKKGGHSAKKKLNAPPGFDQPPSYNVSKPALLLWNAREQVVSKLGEEFDAVQRASDDRAALENRKIVFDRKNNYSLVSRELALALRSDSDLFEPSPLVVNSDVDELLNLLPSRMREALEEIGTEKLTDVVMDKGRTPYAWIDNKRLFLKDEDNPCVEQADIDFVTGALWFGTDNRAGLERQLHRVSCMLNRAGNIIGLTLRVGRNIDGNADMICDLLLGMEGSILFLGEPGSGKTTIVREAARLLSEDDLNVCVIDTSNEIAGDGDVPHPCVGHSRRMMVPSLDKQASVMIECVQNHTPTVMVIDEIGRPTEVEAARTCKQRGVRMIASAHGDLRKLVKNPKLKGLIGGTETVTLGDAAAKSEAKEKGFSAMSKLKSQRIGAPVFDMIVEVRRDFRHEWYITLDTAAAVDAVLDGKQYEVQRRVRNPSDGSFQVIQEMR